MESNFNDGKNFAGKPFSGHFPGRIELDQMSETPKRVSHHRRAQSETFFRLPDDFLFDADVDFNLAGIDIPSLSMSEDNDDSHPMSVDTAGKSEETTTKGGKLSGGSGGGSSHFRSLSVGSEFFEGLGLQATSGFEGERFGEKGGMVLETETRGNHHHHHRQHRHSNSMDGSCSSLDVEPIESAKKAMGPDKLAELARIDPKRAKRILANRQSAARSKERKIRYTSELERKVQTLQTEATTLSAQVTMLQRDTSGLTTENKELKLRLQAMEQEAHLRDALNDALKEEVQRLKIATGQVPAVNGNTFNGGRTGSFLSPSQRIHQFSIPQHQQHQQLNISQSSVSNPSLGGQSQHRLV